MLVLTRVISAVLIVTGIVVYFVTDRASFTALIPTFVGVLLLITALIAGRGDKARKHALHVAMAIALLGALGSLRNVLGLGDLIAGNADAPGAVIASTIMFVALVVLLVAGVRSFIAARRSTAVTANPSE